MFNIIIARYAAGIFTKLIYSAIQVHAANDRCVLTMLRSIIWRQLNNQWYCSYKHCTKACQQHVI